MYFVKTIRKKMLIFLNFLGFIILVFSEKIDVK